MKRINLRVSDEMNDYLEAKAEKSGLTKNAVIIMALENYATQQSMLPHIGDMLEELKRDREKV